MVRKVRQEERSQPDFKAVQAFGWGATLSANPDLDADSVQVALREWEQLWKDTMRKNENALIRARRKAPRSTAARR
jgi:hypothetical protein